MSEARSVFITGGTGYLGRPLIASLLQRGHHVRRSGARGIASQTAGGCQPILGNALDAASYAEHIPPCDTFVQLVGVAHPSPAKGEQFRSIDLVSATSAIDAATRAGVRHFVYLSVAQPAPMMKDYIAVRAECEDRIRASGMDATVLRPWYVLGPGHRWPYLLIPMYRAAERIPSLRDGAQRLGLVTLRQMQCALLNAIEAPHPGFTIMDVPKIRAAPAIP